MVSVSSALLPGGGERRAGSARRFTVIAAGSCAALLIASVLVYKAQGAYELLTTVQQNCDG
jgi:hypothetical protein